MQANEDPQVIGKMNIDKGIIISALPEGESAELKRPNRLNILRCYEINESEYNVMNEETWGELTTKVLPIDSFMDAYLDNNCE